MQKLYFYYFLLFLALILGFSSVILFNVIWNIEWGNNRLGIFTSFVSILFFGYLSTKVDTDKTDQISLFRIMNKIMELRAHQRTFLSPNIMKYGIYFAIALFISLWLPKNYNISLFLLLFGAMYCFFAIKTFLGFRHK